MKTRKEGGHAPVALTPSSFGTTVHPNVLITDRQTIVTGACRRSSVSGADDVCLLRKNFRDLYRKFGRNPAKWEGDVDLRKILDSFCFDLL